MIHVEVKRWRQGDIKIQPLVPFLKSKCVGVSYGTAVVESEKCM